MHTIINFSDTKGELEIIIFKYICLTAFKFLKKKLYIILKGEILLTTFWNIFCNTIEKIL